MGKSRYEKRLSGDLDRWIGRGLIAAENRAAILDDVSSRANGWSASGALAILGSVLLALAALSFVAANWAELGNGLRLALIFAAIWGSYLGATRAFATQHPAIGHALALLGAALFGVSIVLVAQIFNMSSWRYTVLGIWAAGALLTALLTPSRPVLIFTAMLGSAWVWAESFNPYAPGVLWAYLPLWLATVVAASRLRSLASINLLAIGLYIWIGFLLWDFARDDRLSELQTASAFILASAATAMTFAALRDRDWFGLGTLTNWGTSLVLLAGFCVQFPLDRYENWSSRDTEIEAGSRWVEIAGSGNPAYWWLAGAFMLIFVLALLWRAIMAPSSRALALPAIPAAVFALFLPPLAALLGGDAVLILRIGLGVAILAIAISLILYGSREGRRFTGGLGIALFVAETLYIYGETFGGLLDTSLFFMIGGLLLFGLSMGVIRFQKRMSPDEEAAP
jgi:uncharacterized membrane protein